MSKVMRNGPLFVSGLMKWTRVRFLSRPLTSLVIGIFAVLTSILIHKVLVQAISNDWVQTDWSGGADTNATADETNLTNWTKYYSKDNGVDASTSGEIKLHLELSLP